jgi:hypothetical protein
VTAVRRVVVLPPIPALLPAYRSRVDPVPELRAACRAAVAWLVAAGIGPVAVLADQPDEAMRARGVDVSLGLRVARHLLAEAGHPGPVDDAAAGKAPLLLVLANGSSRRGPKAPGHLDPRSFDFDSAIEKALADGDPAGLTMIDADLGGDLLAAGIEPLRRLGSMCPGMPEAHLRYAGDPYGVRYWVATWLLGDSGVPAAG